MKINGVIVPIVTPFDKENRLDLAALEKLLEHFIEKGVHGVVACGTTGEYYALNDVERQQVLACIARVAKGRISLIAGANDLSTQGAILRAKQAAELGYEALMMAPPAYSLPNQAEIIAHYKAVAEVSPLPIIMYNFPARAGVEIDIDSVLELAKLPNIIGLKESSGNFSRALAIIQAKLPNFEVVCGCDDQAADFLFWGVTSWISGAANVFPAEQVAMLRAAQGKDWAEVKQLMTAMYPVIQSMESGGYNQKAKLGCLRHDIQVGEVRQPLQSISATEATHFQQLMQQFIATQAH
ncbi:4-hydroxy-tetrahydrodipicolinate synthase [Solimicrobium silvestre]|uniref:4-hydroxy-tetrahydrodipicolinate synthase n=1 Tax=Solimicrobium silvestre TaxID=2099400 RepID=A0A2S9GYU6_9BURK|nr:4-hydroxy-tetrahydrodipicolinate synthase [Solimicrobium silvestre]PRC92883.1 dapA: dihydrodipicolinate synthase [Solimicrobium silvestre]